MPKIEKFTIRIDDFHEKVNEIKETVRHFDESLCVKASKGELLQQRNFIEDNYTSKKNWQKLNDDYESMLQIATKSYSKMQDGFEQFKG